MLNPRGGVGRLTIQLTAPLLVAAGLALPSGPVAAAQVDCPDGVGVVLDREQVCYPHASGLVPEGGGPFALDIPRGTGGGLQEWCVRHDQREASSLVNPWRVPCRRGSGPDASWFSVAWDCYVSSRDQISVRDPDWPRRGVGEGEEGRVFEIQCYPPQEDATGLMFMNGFGLWQATQLIIGPENPPGLGGTPSVIPALWVEAVNALAMRGPQIVTAPPLGGAALVNLPVWLWTERGGRVWPQGQPLQESAAAAGHRVDAYAEPLRLRWDMGDGRGQVICPGPGTPWQRGMDFLSPGDCHHIYLQDSRDQPSGVYEIVAVTTWRVWWDINGQPDGELEIEVGSTAVYQVDEIQVLTG